MQISAWSSCPTKTNKIDKNNHEQKRAFRSDRNARSEVGLPKSSGQTVSFRKDCRHRCVHDRMLKIKSHLSQTM